MLRWDGGKGRWIPAFAGMTWVCAGMTWVGEGMMWVGVGVCGNDGGSSCTTGVYSDGFPPSRE